MINLIPKEEKKRIVKVFYYKLVILFLMVASGSIFLALVSILPSYFISLEKNNIVHFHTYPRCPKQNSEIERFNRTISEAFISRNLYLLAYDIDAFNEKLMEWLLWYNTRRPHWSLGLISPLRYIVSTLSAEESQMCWTNTKTLQ